MAIYILGPDQDGNCCTCEERVNVCDTCGEPVECSCVMLIPGNLQGSIPWGISTYPDYASAVSAIVGFVSNCIGYGQDAQSTPAPLALFTADDSITPGTLTLHGKGNPGLGVAITMYVSLVVNEGANLTFSFVLNGPTTNLAIVELLDCATGTVIYSDSSALSPIVFSSIPSGIWIVRTYGTSSDGNVPPEITFSITCNTPYVISPLLALWDDSGTTRKLEACPKMLLPPPNGDSWYINQVIAQAVLDDPLKVSNCVGYAENNSLTPFTSFTANGGSSLVFVAAGFGFFANTGPMWGSINAVVGATITATTDGSFIQLTIYDYNGNFVSSSFANPGTTTTSSALPYTGRYTVQVISSRDPGGSSSITVSVTSFSSISTNLVQALYDVGIDCPARLNCS